MQLQLTLPDDIVVGLKIPPEKIKDEILREIAFLFYAQGKASMSRKIGDRRILCFS